MLTFGQLVQKVRKIMASFMAANRYVMVLLTRKMVLALRTFGSENEESEGPENPF